MAATIVMPTAYLRPFPILTESPEVAGAEVSGWIYLLTNSRNGKKYVGQTRVSPERRWRQHATEADNGGNFLLHKAIRKHGWGAFTREVLWAGIASLLNEMEVRFIAEYASFKDTGNGYNLTTGGGAGAELSEDARRRIGKASKERWAKMTQEERDRIAKASMDAKTPEVRRASAARASSAAKARSDAMTPEERTAQAKAIFANMTPEQRAAFSVKLKAAHAAKTPEQRSAQARARDASMTPEARRARSKAGAATLNREEYAAKAKAAHWRKTSEQRSTESNAARERMTPERRAANSERLRARMAARTPEEVREHVAKCSAKRRKAADERARYLTPIIVEIRAEGAITKTHIADALYARGIASPSGGTRWQLSSLNSLLKRVSPEARKGISAGNKAHWAAKTIDDRRASMRAMISASVASRRNAAEERAQAVAHVIEAIIALGVTGARVIAAELNARGIAAAGGEWNQSTVRKVLGRIAAHPKAETPRTRKNGGDLEQIKFLLGHS